MEFKKGDKVMITDGFCKGDNGRILDIWTGDLALVEVGDSGYVIPFNLLEHYRVRGFEPTKNAPQDTLLPVRGSENSAGYDFYAPYDILIPAHGKSELVFFNVKAYMQDDEYLYMRIRSGLGTKHEIMLETSGVIDADYYGNETTDGNIATVFRNHSDKDFLIKKGERCCQGIFMKYLVADNDKTLGCRRGGYGSTGF